MNGYDPLKLDHQLCFPLYVASREVIRLYTPYLKALDLTYTQYVAMMALWEAKSLPIKALCERLHLDTGTVTPLLKSMEQKGLISRRRSETDERSVTVALTEKGTALREQALSVPQKVGSCIPLAPEDASALCSLLYQLIGELQ